MRAISRDELVRHFHYDPETGVFTRLSRRNSYGSKDAYGYHILKINGVQYKAHRLAWLYHYGCMPEGNIDHINGDRSDNRIFNLRDVEQSSNCRNMRFSANNDTGVVGVYLDRTRGLKKRFATKVMGKTFRFHEAEVASEFRELVLSEAGYSEGHY